MSVWPSVGVVIPTRDRPQLLARAIAGVVAQDYPGPVRIVVVYDRSNPDPQLCRGGDRPLDVLPNLRRAGLAGSRNTGIVALDTELVAAGPRPSSPPARSRSTTAAGSPRDSPVPP